MLNPPNMWLFATGLVILGFKFANAGAIPHHYPYCNSSSISTTAYTLPAVNTTSTSSVLYHSSTTTCTTTSSIPVYNTTHMTISHDTTSTTSCITASVSSAITSAASYPSKSTSTTGVPPTITSSASYISYSLTSGTTVDSCPTTCSIYAGTVELFFWPTNNDYTYPATYVDMALDYTFTSPSVYMVINTIYGYNSLGTAGPSASSIIFPLDLDEVSTIVPGGQATRQLSLSDLGTDCPQTADPSAIATMTDPRCDPVLVAPDAVKSWANPCNACGKFGLFDPPYAITTITGGLLGATTTTKAGSTTVAVTTATSAATGATATAVRTTEVLTPVTTLAAATGFTVTASQQVVTLGPSGIVVVYYYSGTVLTTTITATSAASTALYEGKTFTLGGEASTITSTAIVVPSPASVTSTSLTASATPKPTEESTITSATLATTVSLSLSSSTPAGVTASAARVTNTAASLIFGIFVFMLAWLL